MEKRNISLRIWMFLNIAPAVLLTFVYWVNVRADSHAIHGIIALIVLSFFGISIYYDRKTDLFDESARENLRLTDSICLKTIYTISTFAVFSSITFDFPSVALELSWVTVGYGIVFSILVITILRAFVFLIIDKRGM